MDHFEPAAWDDGLQEILNAHPVPRRFVGAHEVIPVRARLIWSYDGLEELDTHVSAWSTVVRQPLLLVAVLTRGGRYQFNNVWLAPRDVWARGASESGGDGAGAHDDVEALIAEQDVALRGLRA